MSLLIKGMNLSDKVPLLTEMNKPTVYNCRLTILSTGKAYLNIVGREEYPVEKVFTPHGRLIDADELYNKLKPFYDMFEGATYIGDKARRDELSNVLAELKCNAPTIIEAEE